MSRELTIIKEFIKSLEESATYLDECYSEDAGVKNAYRKGRVQGMRDCILTLKKLFYCEVGDSIDEEH